MTFQSAPNCAEAVINGDYHGKAIANVLNFQFGLPYSQSDLNNLSATIDTAVGTYYRALMNNSVTYVNTHVRGLTSAIDLESFNNASAGSGSAGAVEMPANAAACLTLRTGHTGRSARGRFYAFPTSSSNTASGQQFTAGYMTALKTFLDAVAAGVLGVPCTWVVLSRFSAGSARPVAISTLITSVVVRNTDIDSQRGRLLSGH